MHSQKLLLLVCVTFPRTQQLALPLTLTSVLTCPWCEYGGGGYREDAIKVCRYCVQFGRKMRGSWQFCKQSLNGHFNSQNMSTILISHDEQVHAMSNFTPCNPSG